MQQFSFGADSTMLGGTVGTGLVDHSKASEQMDFAGHSQSDDLMVAERSLGGDHGHLEESYAGEMLDLNAMQSSVLSAEGDSRNEPLPVKALLNRSADEIGGVHDQSSGGFMTSRTR